MAQRPSFGDAELRFPHLRNRQGRLNSRPGCYSTLPSGLSVDRTFRAKVNTDNEIYLEKNDSGSYFITRGFLRLVYPSLDPRRLTAFKVTIHKEGQELFSYHVYRGGKFFAPSLPKGHAIPGQSLSISIDLLPAELFVKGLQSFGCRKPSFARWVSDISIANRFSLSGNTIEIGFSQDNRFVDGVESFVLKGRVDKYPGTSNQFGGVYLQFTLLDYAGRTISMRIAHDGVSAPALQINRGAGFETVSLVSYDGFRLSVVYGGTDAISMVYQKAPSEAIYAFGSPEPCCESYLTCVDTMISSAVMIPDVRFKRKLELAMYDRGYKRDLARLGTEIAFLIGTNCLGLRSLMIQEPTQGGRDLFTPDSIFSIQARLLKDFTNAKPQDRIRTQLLRLLGQLDWDFYHNPSMRVGYAILTFPCTTVSLGSIVLEVRRN